MTRPLVALGVAIALAATAGCATHPAPTTVAAPVPVATLTIGQAGTSTTLSPGQTIEIRLPATVSTGYRWSFTLSAGSVLEADGAPGYEAPADGPTRTGASGTAIFRFKARRPGEESLRFEYRRPWETGPAPAQLATFTIQVR